MQTYIETPDNPRVGWKLAATSIAGKNTGVSGPIVGRITSKMSLSLGQFVSTKANNMTYEPELGFVFNRRIEPNISVLYEGRGDGTYIRIKAWFEFPNSRFIKFETAGELSLIADNACAHEFMLDLPPEIWRNLELGT